MNAISSFWRQLEGAILDGKYNLRQCLAAEEDRAIFLTELPGDEPRRAAVKLVRTGSGTEGDILSRWNTAMGLSHPNLVEIFAVERAEIDGASVLYAVMDYAEDNLGSVLRDRALSEAETLDVLESVLPALGYLHGKGLVHGHIKPANILAVGDIIKMSSDGLGRAGDSPGAPLNAAAYDAPETAAGIASPASDMWSLGMIVCEMLTQRLPETGADPEQFAATLPDRFRELVRHCLRTAPEQRWSVARVAESLRPVAAEPPAKTVPKRGHWKWLAAAALSVGVLAAVLTRKTEPPAPPEIRPVPAAKPPQVAPRPTPFSDRKPEQEFKPPEEQPAPRPGRGEASRNGLAVWRVIAYTYTRPEDAGKKIREINHRWPEYKAEVFSLNPGQPPYLVSIGGRMPRDNALRLLRKARAAGLPADSYMQNFSH